MEIKTTQTKQARDWNIFYSSVFFVLGFSLVFALVGVLLQTVLSHVGAVTQIWLGRVGGMIIILFGLFLLGIIKPAFLTRQHTFAVKKRFKSHFITSFVFGAAFAVGWTPCVTAALGAILGLATSSPSSAFVLLFAYTMGLGVPFLLVGLFTEKAEGLINRGGKAVEIFQKIFAVILVILGILIFVGELSKIANFKFLTEALLMLNAGFSGGSAIASLSLFNIAISFIAGLASFLSPCVLPIIPGFLSYLASTATNKKPTSATITS
jgi:cytochrome c-type biogenesis protein